MLPLPGAPSSSWAMYRARIRAVLNSGDLRVVIAFWLLGLINNVLYVIILSAALDLVGPDVPKGVVLLADVVPSLIIKACAPYFIHAVPYGIRVVFFATVSTLGMLLVGLTPSHTDGSTISAKMVGVVLASLTSGGGELSFLSLTHFYGHNSLASWSSGTGGAGLIGAGAYALATTVMGLSVQNSLLASAFLPIIMLISFFVILPRDPLRNARHDSEGRRPPPDEEESTDSEDGQPPFSTAERAGLLDHSGTNEFTGDAHVFEAKKSQPWWQEFKKNFSRSQHLFFPFMLPLLLVYIAEYTINQGVAPTLIFPLHQTPFKHFRSFYPTYNAIYQMGVFISRSSTPFLRVHNLYVPSCLQVGNLILLIIQAVFDFIPSVYIIFIIVFCEGLLGGAVYVNTYAEILDTIPQRDREFSLGATSVSDSAGICIAGFLGMALEVFLCNYQVKHGKDFCTKL